MLQLNRIYKNSDGDEIRIDTISLVRKRNSIVNANLMETGASDTFRREVKTILFHGSSNRTVSTIEVLGDFTSIETATSNYLWAEWSSPSARLSMNDLPKLTETV